MPASAQTGPCSPPFADAGGYSDGRESPNTSIIELYVTPWDELDWRGPDTGKSSDLAPGEIIGIQITVPDFDRGCFSCVSPSYDGFFTLSGVTGTFSQADGFVDAELVPCSRGDCSQAPSTIVEVDTWAANQSQLPHSVLSIVLASGGQVETLGGCPIPVRMRTAANPGPPVVLVTIDSRPVVTSADLAAFHDKLPEHLRSPSSGVSAVRDLLQTLVDRELMVMEAAALGYADEPEVTRRLHDSLVRRVSQHVIDRQIGRGTTAIPDRLVEETYT